MLVRRKGEEEEGDNKDNYYESVQKGSKRAK
jgi:hypothetical protein